jgi:hypothetical protein
MIAQFFLTALLAGIFLYAWIEYERSPFIGLVAVVAAWTGVYFVWFPSHATVVAEAVGIGRGVDLILYTWVGISFILLLNLHLKMRAQMELLTGLARELAFLRAEEQAARLPIAAGRLPAHVAKDATPGGS